jgi:hypothetical protein
VLNVFNVSFGKVGGGSPSPKAQRLQPSHPPKTTLLLAKLQWNLAKLKRFTFTQTVYSPTPAH